jgi:hypothetical protein
MKSAGASTPALLVAGLLFPEAIALPTEPLEAVKHLVQRQSDVTKPTANTAGAAGNVAGVVKKILAIIDEKTAAYDYLHQPVMCEIRWYNDDHGRSQAFVTCPDKVERAYDFSNNEADRTSDFFDDRIGPFHITWGKEGTGSSGGNDGNVLDNPILNVDYVDNGSPWDASGIARQQSNPEICNYKYDVGYDGDLKSNTWRCGVPLTGRGAAGIDSSGPVNADGWRPGWCGLHVTQHQKADPAKDNYVFDVKLFDDNGSEIGKEDGINLPTDQQHPVSSKLPMTITVKAPATDGDAIWFFYGSNSWTSNDQPHQCNFGPYDGGKREGDCGFTCDGPAPAAS